MLILQWSMSCSVGCVVDLVRSTVGCVVDLVRSTVGCVVDLVRVTGMCGGFSEGHWNVWWI